MAKRESKDFYEVLDYYLEMIRNLHKRTYEYLSHKKASMNPVAFCEGGLWNGHLGLNDEIKPCLESATLSFGVTALNELQTLHNGKSLVEDNKFSLEVMKFINKRLQDFKSTDKLLYAVYGTPGETLLPLQAEQFKRKFGVIKGVSDREYLSNSFHCHVSEDITPAQKQDIESEFWDLFNGGHIQYVKYPNGYNKNAIRKLVRRAMDYGFYEGVNLDICECTNCGHSTSEHFEICPNCGSTDITEINRVCGYLGYSKIKGNSRMNDGKLAEIIDRKSM